MTVPLANHPRSNRRRQPPALALLRYYFQQAHLTLTDEQAERFWHYHRLLRQHNTRLNLTRLYAFESMVVKHYIDCALLATMLDLPSPLMDLGSGAGLPGIPLAIMRPDLKIILAEGRQPRVGFLRTVVAALGLDNVTVYSGKIYDDSRLDPPANGVITRAVESMADTIQRLHGCLAGRGQAIFMKGPEGIREIPAVTHRHPDYRLTRQTAYALPILGDDRLLVVFTRDSAPNRTARPAILTSRDNLVIKKLLALQTAKGIKEHGELLLGGDKLIREVLRDQPAQITGWINTPDHPPPAAAAQVPWILLSRERFREINTLATPGPLITLRAPAMPPFDPAAPWPPGGTLLIPFGDPENVGAVIRSAMALGAQRVVLLREAACPFLPKAIRASAGTVLKARLERGPALTDLGSDDRHPIFILDPQGRPLDQVTPPACYGLLAGMEGQGVPANLLQPALRVAIPLAPTVESLNAASAVAIALWQWRRLPGAGPDQARLVQGL